MGTEFDGVDWDAIAAGYEAGGQAGTSPTTIDGAGNLPNTGTSVSGWGDVLRSVTNPLLDVAKTALELQVTRDTLANQAADRALDRYAKQVQIDGARNTIGLNARLAELSGATALAKAQDAFRSSLPASAASTSSTYLMIALGLGLLYFMGRR